MTKSQWGTGDWAIWRAKAPINLAWHLIAGKK